ncbi:MAG: V-type ATP synthase subunit I [Spirochaetaceae bacterium]|jgi:V/A-type H+-transporting ATPase subunit I|nr:V-type ATP synthase subunit I [Spirochaetaceae bacterium]
MIVPMKKVSLFFMDKSSPASLERLRELGLVHLEKRTVASDTLSKLLDRKVKSETALGILRTYKNERILPSGAESNDLTTQVLTLVDERKTLQEQLLSNTKECMRIEKWGNFEPDDLKKLAEQGIILIPYELPYKTYNTLSDDQKFIVLGSDKTTVYGLAVEKEIAGETPWSVPERSLSELNDSAVIIRNRLDALEKELLALAAGADRIKDDLARIIQDIEFETARLSMEKLDEIPSSMTISWLTGFVPHDNIGMLKRAATENGWALSVTDPTDADNPPTLVKNKAFVRLIQPLFSFLGTVPGYREYDISFSYLLFFCLFFAMIFGDAAYGTLILIITLCVGSNYKKKTGTVPDAVKLFGLLSCCTIVWGALNGAWFAIPYEHLPSFLQVLVIPQFNPSVPLAEFPMVLRNLFKIPAEQPSNTAYWNIQFLCFSVALVQLVLAHIKNILKLAQSATKAVAVAQAGWLVMMIGLYFLVLSMLLQIALPSFATYLIAFGLATYFIFSEQKGGNSNPLVNVGKSFANFLPTFLNAVSSFADIISYIRLFAVGLAGTSIAQSFNAMSGLGNDLGTSIVTIILKLVAGILILAFGHVLNMIMNALSVIVHGVRLNLLEYAGNHLGMEWSGYSYKPFALKQKSTK